MGPLTCETGNCMECSNELIRVINVICIISLHGGRENCMIELYKGDIVHDLCSTRIS